MLLSLRLMCALAALALAAPLCAQQISATPVANVPTTDGTVTAIVEHNGILYIGGSFSQVGGQARARLAAIDISTGNVLAWNPSPNSTVSDMVVSSSGDLYICGAFTQINGQARGTLASFNLGLMSMPNFGLSTWAPSVTNTVVPFFFGTGTECLAIMNNRLYVGGFFDHINGSERGGAASFDLTALGVNSGLTTWDPNTWTNSGAPFQIWGVFNMYAHAASNTLVMTGPFEAVGGNHVSSGTPSPHAQTLRSGIAAIDGTSGACKAWDPDCGSTTWSDEALCGQGNIVYLGGVGYSVHGGGTTVTRSNTCGLDVTVNTATTNPATGFNPGLNERPWVIGVHPAGSLVIMCGQWTTVGGTPYGNTLGFAAASGAVIANWNPSPDVRPATIHVNATRVYLGGSFTTIAGQTRSGLAAFDINMSGSPELDVSRGTTAITDGGSDAVGSAFTAGSASTLTYTFANSGNAALTLANPASITGLSNCSVSIATAPAASVAASASTSTVLSVTPAASGAFSFSYSIGNNDSNENPYNFTVSGSASAAAAPEIDFMRGTLAIADGGSDNIGSAFTAGSGGTVTYLIRNLGSATLTLSNPASITSLTNCSVSISGAPGASVAPAASGNTTLIVTPAAAGSFSFTYSLGNNDANENPYNFTVSGSATAAPAPELNVQRGSTPIADGGTDSVGSAFTAGVASQLTYTLANAGTATLTLSTASITGLSNCNVSVTTAPAASVLASSYASTTLSITPIAAGAFAFSYSIVNNDSNENPYNFTVSGSAASAPAPEISVARGSMAIVDGGTDTVSSATAGVSQGLTYSISNSGTASLTLGTPSIGALSNCTVAITTAPASSVAAAGSTATVLSVTPVAAGAFGFTCSIANNDANENPYNWSVSGNASAAPAPELDVTRSATAIADGGTDSVSAAAGTSLVLTYTFSNTGSAALTLTTPVAAPGSLVNCTASITAQPAAMVATAGSTTLAITVTPAAAGAFSLTLSVGNNDANENPYDWTIAGNASSAPAPEMDVSRGATPVADGGMDSVGNVTNGAPQSLTYTIANNGQAGLNLTGAPALVAVTPGANVSSASVTVQPAASVAASGTTTFTITYVVSGTGSFSLGVSIDNNDANEAPYNWTAFGAGTGSAPELDIARGATTIADGGSDPGLAATAQAPLSLAYTLSNSGGTDLQITTPVTVLNAVNCIVVVTQQPSATVAGGGNTALILEVTPAADGVFGFEISVSNNDADESPYNWSASGTATAASSGGSHAGPPAGGGGCIASDDGAALWLLVLLPVLFGTRMLRRRNG